MTPISISDWVKAARGSLTQTQFFHRCGIRQTNLSMLESGANANPTYRTLLAIAEASEGRVSLTLSVTGETSPSQP